jgi:hypothetical protein
MESPSEGDIGKVIWDGGSESAQFDWMWTVGGSGNKHLKWRGSASSGLKSGLRVLWLFCNSCVIASELNLRFSKSFESVCRKSKGSRYPDRNPFNDRCINGSNYFMGNGAGVFSGSVISTSKPKIYCQQFRFRYATQRTRISTNWWLCRRYLTMTRRSKIEPKNYRPSVTKDQFLPDSSGISPWFG